MPLPLSFPRVYQALLTRRYLSSKVMPLLAALAVMLCCAMELIVWSVMGGFLVMLMDSGRTLIGDVEISHDNTGLAYYQDLIDPQDVAVQRVPRLEAEHAVPLLGDRLVGRLAGEAAHFYREEASRGSAATWRPSSSCP